MACLIIRKNIFLPQCFLKPGQFVEMIETPRSFVIPAADLDDAAAVKAAFQTAMLAGIASRAYLYPRFFNTENQSEAQVRAQTSLGTSFVRNGKYRFLHQMDVGMCTHTAMATHRSTSGRVFYRDSEGNLFGTELSNGDMAGHSFSLLSPENMVPSDGTNPSLSGMFVELANSDEWNKRGLLIDGAFVDELERLADATIAVVGAITSSLVNVRVATTCDDVSVEGLVAGDFSFLKTSDGTAQTIATAVYDATTETYAIAGTGFVDGTISLKAPSVTTEPYEVETPATVNVP